VFDFRLEKKDFFCGCCNPISLLSSGYGEGGAVFSVRQGGRSLQLTIPSNVKVEGDFTYAMRPLHFVAGVFIN